MHLRITAPKRQTVLMSATGRSADQAAARWVEEHNAAIASAGR